MPMEIERKFLLASPDPLKEIPSIAVRQGYLARGEKEEARVRRAGGEHTLTVKKGGGLTREEFQTALTAEQFDALWPATSGARVDKRRFAVPLPGRRTAYVDVFDGCLSGLATVEVEFATEAEALAFEPPDWFGTEVTEDGRYANRELSVAEGVPD